MVAETVTPFFPTTTWGVGTANCLNIRRSQSQLKICLWTPTRSESAIKLKNHTKVTSIQPFQQSVTTKAVKVTAEQPQSQELSGSDQNGSLKFHLEGTPEYKDSFFDLAFIHLCRVAFGKVAGWQSPRGWKEGYLGMVEVSHALVKGRSANQQQTAVLQGFPAVPPWFRALFPYSDWGAQLNATITPLFFQWLVGPATVEEGEVSEGKILRSTVVIDRCRYLETSGCTAMCVNLCKVPTQRFFTTELGMPLYMEPNFETLGCKMVFGQTPPPIGDDVVMTQPCFSTCPSANSARPSCPKLL